MDVNQSALEITGISEETSGIDLFENHTIAQKREKLVKEGSIKFQAPLDFENIKNTGFSTLTKSGTIFIDWNISVIDAGFLVQIQDVTKVKKSEESLKESEKYRRWFDEDLTGDFIATPEGKVIECNSAFAEIYGFNNCKDAVQADISKFNSDDWKNLIKRLKTEHKVQGHQSTHKRPDGKEIHIVANVVAIFNDFGELVQVKGYVFDDTERKEAEDALMGSEEKYRRLFDEDLTGDFIATPEGKILECNPAFAEIYGFQGCGKAVRSEISQFNPAGWATLIDHLRDERKIQGYQRWHVRPDGKEIHVVANVVGIFNDSGALVQVKGYVFDDTERKEAEDALMGSEEKYRRLFDEDLTGDFIATPKGEIIECNPAFAEIYGFDDCKKALQWNISKSNPFDWPYMVTRLKSEGKIKGYQSWQRRSDGLRIHVVANVVGIFNDSGEIVQVKGYVFDDTERKKTEQELIHSKSQITEILDSIKDGFVALNHYWNFIYVNQRAAQYVGVEPDELVGQNLWERFPELVGTNYETAFRRARDEQEIQYFKAQCIRMNDHGFDVSVYPLNEGISVYWRDITQHKKPEKN
ncbi:putative PAS/PAC sensor protein [Methanobacterium paludis]|uniref:histidine kinase n=1 Tax=Methanobacterium paludis (strain DSM 25820 / JCM 18151 / SWAN1) TaxID=868131 RepID=F6D3Z3_METPW|nr:putative PAS/PAC sensor protein [Methanobacterium paludis]